MDTPSRAAPNRRRDEGDDMDDRPRGKKKKQETSSKAPLIIGLSVGGAVLVGAVVLVVVLMMGKEKPNETDQNRPSRMTPIQPAVGGKNAAPPVNPNPAPPVPEKQPDPPPVIGGVAVTGNDIYKYVIKSTAWIVNAEPGVGGSTGTGTLIDTTNMLILTSLHVVGHSAQVAVFFPIYKDKEEYPIAEKTTYMQKLNDPQVLRATVVERDIRRGMAIIQLARLPPGVEALPLANKSPNAGQVIYSIGNPGGSAALWMVSKGDVRQVVDREWISSGGAGSVVYNLKAKVVETSSPISSGDSGGPCVNERGEQIGVTQGKVRGVDLVTLCIDVTEALDFIDKTCKKKNMTWVRARRAPLTSATR